MRKLMKCIASTVALLLASAPMSPLDAELTNGMTSCWSFDDGTAIDLAGTSNGTCVQGPSTGWSELDSCPQTPLGVADSTALTFNGLDLSVDFGLVPGEWNTFSLWVALATASSAGDPGGDPDSWHFVFGDNASPMPTNTNMFTIGPVTGQAEGEIVGLLVNDNVDFFYWTGDDIGDIDTEFHHYLFAWDAAASNYRFYFDGQDKGLGSIVRNPGKYVDVDFRLGVGQWSSVSEATTFFEGRVDQIAVWDRSLSPSEIAAVHSSPQICPPPPAQLSCSGFGPPIGESPVKVRGNRALPFKAQLIAIDGTEATDLELASPPVIQVLYDSGSGGMPVDVTQDALPTGMGTEGNQFEYGGEIWQFNLKTNNFTAPGTYTVFLDSGDTGEYVIDPLCFGTFVIEH